MVAWLVTVFLVAVVGTEVWANSPVTFIENLYDNRYESTSGSRIVSGWEAQPGQFPHQISLRMVSSIGGVSSCGGSIISPEWGITAAHCPAGRVSVIVRAGLVNLTTPMYIFETTKYYNHPYYYDDSPFVQPHDIGLVEFGRTLPIGEFIKPIRLQRSSEKDRNYNGEVLVASGWGRTWSDSVAAEHLNWVFLRGNTNEQCRMSYGPIVVDSTICASYYNVTSQSTCQGDSGGPLSIIDDDGQYSMIGVASFVSGRGCHVGMPAGFIRPGHYHQWFTEITGENFDWEYNPVTNTDAPTTASWSPTTEDGGTGGWSTTGGWSPTTEDGGTGGWSTTGGWSPTTENGGTGGWSTTGGWSPTTEDGGTGGWSTTGGWSPTTEDGGTGGWSTTGGWSPTTEDGGTGGWSPTTEDVGTEGWSTSRGWSPTTEDVGTEGWSTSRGWSPTTEDVGTEGWPSSTANV